MSSLQRSSGIVKRRNKQSLSISHYVFEEDDGTFDLNLQCCNMVHQLEFTIVLQSQLLCCNWDCGWTWNSRETKRLITFIGLVLVS